jgi:hypothetical protein
MSRYGSVAITSPASVLTKIVESSLPDDLAARTNAALAAVPDHYVVVGITLAGAGDGFTFTVTIEAGAEADTTGGFPVAPSVVCFLASEADALLLARNAAAPGSGSLADTQVAGAAKGTRFMGLLVLGDLATGASLLQVVEDDATITNVIPDLPDFVLRSLAVPLQVNFPSWNAGDVLVVEVYSERVINPEASVQVAYILTPKIDVGAGFQSATPTDGNSLVGSVSALSGISLMSTTAVRLNAAPTVRVEMVNAGNSGENQELQKCLLRAYRYSGSSWIQGPVNTLV